jgi:phosphate starvation-inducible PhoH-like protein
MEKTLHFVDDRYLHGLYCNNPRNLDYAANTFSVKIVARGDFLKISGDEKNVNIAEEFFCQIDKMCHEGYHLTSDEFTNAVNSACSGIEKVKEIFKDRILVPGRKHYIVPKTPGQREYVRDIRDYDIVFSIGPAGTGKTYLAMAMAVNAFMQEKVSRIILTRPAVEAGEALGFLPGDMYEKVDPYLRPLYDALYDMMEFDRIQTLREKGIIEVAPLAFMRGRTLNDSFIILDEAQNTTQEQMKMFLTRLGFDSKVVITGDITQVDLPQGKLSGLIHVEKILKNIEGIKISYFTDKDVVRHELVTKIIRAYDEERKL